MKTEMYGERKKNRKKEGRSRPSAYLFLILYLQIHPPPKEEIETEDAK